MVIRITYPNHGHGSDFLCFLLMNYNEVENDRSFIICFRFWKFVVLYLVIWKLALPQVCDLCCWGILLIKSETDTAFWISKKFVYTFGIYSTWQFYYNAWSLTILRFRSWISTKDFNFNSVLTVGFMCLAFILPVSKKKIVSAEPNSLYRDKSIIATAISLLRTSGNINVKFLHIFWSKCTFARIDWLLLQILFLSPNCTKINH